MILKLGASVSILDIAHEDEEEVIGRSGRDSAVNAVMARGQAYREIKNQIHLDRRTTPYGGCAIRYECSAITRCTGSRSTKTPGVCSKDSPDRVADLSAFRAVYRHIWPRSDSWLATPVNRLK